MNETQVHVRVDRSVCSGHGRCAAKGPEVYALDDDGYAASEDFVVPISMIDTARAGARACPERVITVTRC